MKDKLHKMFLALLVAGFLIALGGATVYGQGRDSALRTGGSNSGSSELSRENRQRRDAAKRTAQQRAAVRATAALSPTDAGVGDIRFADMARELGVAEADLKNEYNDDREDFSWLNEVNYLTVKMLIHTARRENDDVEISRRDFLKSMVKGTLPAQYLVNKGFTAAEAEKIIKTTDQRLTAISKASQK